MTAIVANIISVLARLSKFWRNSEPTTTSLHQFGFPYPRIFHYTLPPRIVEKKRLLVIGDVHGCYDELMELLEVAGTSDDTLLLFVGDLVNKGPKSKQVLDFVRQSDRAYSVRGNHDESCLRELVRMARDQSHRVSDKYAWLLELTEEDRDFLLELPYTIAVGEPFGVLVVHAGLVPGKPLVLQAPQDMVTMRNVVERDPWEGGPLASKSSKEGGPWASAWPGPQHVYFGHDARRLWQSYPHATGLDTGCVYGKRLTAVLLSPSPSGGAATQRYSVNAKQVYSPVD